MLCFVYIGIMDFGPASCFSRERIVLFTIHCIFARHGVVGVC